MPVARIKMPDGRIAKVRVPDGATPEQALEFVQSQQEKTPEQEAALERAKALEASRDDVANPLAGMSAMERALAGYGAAIPNLVAGVRQRLGLASQDEIDQRKREQAPLMNDAAGMAGNVVGNVAAFAPTAFIPGANTVTGAAALGGVYGALQPTATGESVATNTALGAAGGGLGQAAGKAVTGALARRASAKAAQGSANAVRDATMKAGQKAGYIVSPANANPTAWNRLLQGIAGKTASGQRAAMMNQATTNRLTRQALGLPDDAPLTPETMKAVRDAAGKAYQNLAAHGKDFVRDAEFDNAVGRIFQPYAKMTGQVKNMDLSAMAALKETLDSVDQLSPDTAIEVIKRLRDATDSFASSAAMGQGNPAAKTLERAHRAAATAVEDMVERNLRASGDDALLNSFREARRLIAKAHTVEKALNPSTGNVIASKLAGQVKRGKPLSGELETIGKFSGAFPRETQEIANSSWLQMPGTSPLDAAVAIGTSVGTSSPLGALTLAIRPAANALITSAPYQASMTTPKYAQSAIANALAAGLKSRGGSYLSRQIPAVTAAN